MTTITINDFRQAGICPKARKVFFERYGLDWRAFVRDGIDVEELRATGSHATKIDELERIAKAREAAK